MDKLLQWSIAQQSGDKEAMERIGQPDPKMLEQLFGGPDEPTLMKQSILILDNDEATDENKLVAFENFEMLIENLDNANNIQNMKLWPSIIRQLSSPKLEFQVLAASIVGIATQNNPNSQEAFLTHEDGLSSLVRLLADPQTPESLVMKTLFALSSLVRNCQEACDKFVALDGWKILNLSKAASERLLLRKLSLVSALLSGGLDNATKEHIHSDGVVGSIAATLKTDGHLGCIEKALNIISTLKASGYEFSTDELDILNQGLKNVEHVEMLSTDDLRSAQQSLS